MPVQLIVSTLTVTAGGGTFSLNTASLVDRYRVRTLAPITLNSNVTFTSTGTVVTGLLYSFEYVGNINADGNTITFFGEAMPDYLTAKECRIECYYDGSAWKVQFIPSINETACIPAGAFVTSPYGLVATSGGSAVSSTATVSAETFFALDVPAGTLKVTGDTIMLVASGFTDSNANVKNISLRNGTAILAENTTNGSPNNKAWKAVSFIKRNSNTTGMVSGSMTIDDSVTDIVAYQTAGIFDWDGSIETFTLRVQCGTASTNNVTCNTFEIYKIVG